MKREFCQRLISFVNVLRGMAILHNSSAAFKLTSSSKLYMTCIYVQKNIAKLDKLRQHKPPPIRRIRISDFGLPDPKRDPDRHQNCIMWSLSHALPLQKISSKSVHKFASNPTDRQTDKQTDKQTAPKT